jgi:hypothetical protein
MAHQAGYYQLCRSLFPQQCFSHILCTGNKHKKQWKKRFFILRDNYLFYYKSDSEKKENKGKWIRLNGAQVRERAEFRETFPNRNPNAHYTGRCHRRPREAEEPLRDHCRLR